MDQHIPSAESVINSQVMQVLSNHYNTCESLMETIKSQNSLSETMLHLIESQKAMIEAEKIQSLEAMDQSCHHNQAQNVEDYGVNTNVESERNSNMRSTVNSCDTIEPSVQDYLDFYTIQNQEYQEDSEEQERHPIPPHHIEDSEVEAGEDIRFKV